jgi:pimeloyl-ACP methyl ester carboxylesterase
MKYAAPAQKFRIAYDLMGSGKPVVLLHDWPGNPTDYNALAPMLSLLTCGGSVNRNRPRKALRGTLAPRVRLTGETVA